MSKNIPIIEHVHNTGNALIATIDSTEVRLSTFRESLWQQGVVYLPPPFTDQCKTIPIFSDPLDEHSDLMGVEGCILDREVAGWMAEFAAGRLKTGHLR